MTSLSKVKNIADLRQLARKKLPLPMFDFIDGGAEDEWSLQNNTRAFDNYELLPRYLNNISDIDLTTSVMGRSINLPFFLSPTGMSRLFHHHKEIGASRAASKHGTMYSLSTMATTSLEEVAENCSGPKMFQIYILKDRELMKEFVQRCKDAKYDSLCLTVDAAVAGNRERDIVNGMTMPPKITFRNFLSYGSSFHWLLNMILNPKFTLENVAHRVDALGDGVMGVIDYVNSQFDRTVTWDDVRWLAEQWDGPFVIKGLQTREDAKLAAEVGASALMVSNHGGRQLDGAAAPIDCIPAIRDQVGEKLELIVDGGIRRGSHIVKALALGANACSIGRPYLYGLAAGGEDGVDKAISILKTEVERTMALMGISSVKDIKASHLRYL